jgi:hypothetical protein
LLSELEQFAVRPSAAASTAISRNVFVIIDDSSRQGGEKLHDTPLRREPVAGDCRAVPGANPPSSAGAGGCADVLYDAPSLGESVGLSLPPQPALEP